MKKIGSNSNADTWKWRRTASPSKLLELNPGNFLSFPVKESVATGMFLSRMGALLGNLRDRTDSILSRKNSLVCLRHRWDGRCYASYQCQTRRLPRSNRKEYSRLFKRSTPWTISPPFFDWTQVQLLKSPLKLASHNDCAGLFVNCEYVVVVAGWSVTCFVSFFYWWGDESRIRPQPRVHHFILWNHIAAQASSIVVRDTEFVSLILLLFHKESKPSFGSPMQPFS